MYPDLQAVVAGWEFELRFKAAIEDDKDNFENDVKDHVSNFKTSDDIRNYNEKTATDEQKTAYYELLDLTDEYKISLDDLIAKLEQLGLIAPQVDADIRNSIRSISDNHGISDRNEYNQLIAYTADFTKEEKRLWLESTKGAKNATEAIEMYEAALEKAQQQANETGNLTFDQAWAKSFTSENDAVKKLGDDLIELAEKGRLTKETFNEVDSNAGNYFKNFGISADEAVDRINKLVDEAKQLSSMSSQISSMAEALGTKKENGFVDADTLAGFDVEVRGLESWDRFQSVLGSTTSSYKECQEAANALATEWVNSGDFLAQLTEQNEEYYKTQLKAMGIENYEEIISYAQSLNEAKEVLAQNSSELGQATQDEIEALIQEGTYSEQTANMILKLYDAKIAQQATTIDTAADCENLIPLAGDANKTSRTVQLLIELMELYNMMESDTYKTSRTIQDYVAQRASEIKAQIDAIANGEIDGIEIEPTVKLGSRGKSSAKKAGKDIKDILKEQLSDLDSVISGITSRIE